MVFKSIMGAMGVGGPSINAVLDSDQVYPGGVLTGTLHVHGGTHGEYAKHAKVELVARVTRKSGDSEYQSDEVIAFAHIPGPIPLGGAISSPFRIDLPVFTPVTSLGGRNFVWLKSGLDVAWAMDPTDKDALQVHPNQAQANVLQAMEQIGFRLYKVDIDPRNSWMGRKWVQEFEFKPATYGRTNYDEVEVTFESQHGNQVEIMLQLDRSRRGLGGFLAEMAGTDESWVRAHIDASSPHAAAMALQHYIR
jgi:sporulation-control protein